jgi:chaperonin GroEL
VSILKEIRFEDEREDDIASVFEEVGRRQDEDAGDGTTTATILATSLVPHVLADVMDINTPIPGMKTVMGIKKQLETELAAATTQLNTLATPVTTPEELLKVANTAMEGHECSKLIADTVFEIGYNSNIALAEGYSGSVTADVVPGIHMPLKIETPAMYTNITRKEAVYEDPLILVANHVFESYSDLAPFMQGMMGQEKPKKRPIVIIAKQFSVPFTAQVVGITRQTGIPILLLSCHGLRDEEIIDIAEFVNARYVDTHPKENQTPQSILFTDAGTAKKVIAGPKQTSFVGGDGIPQGRVSTRVEDLKRLSTTEQNPEERKLLIKRAAGLQGGVATIYIDAKTAVDRYYLKKKVEDAVNSCKAALEYGTVPGGGLALKAVAEYMEKNYLAGYLSRALPAIYERVQKNAGGSLLIDPETVRDALYTDRCAIENAVAVVKILVTLEGVIADKEHTLVDDLAKKLGYDTTAS